MCVCVCVRARIPVLIKVGESGISALEIMTNEEKEFKTKGPEWKRPLRKEVKSRKGLRSKEHHLYVRLLSLREIK